MSVEKMWLVDNNSKSSTYSVPSGIFNPFNYEEIRKEKLKEITDELDELIKKGIKSTELPYEKFIILLDELDFITDSLIYSPSFERCSDEPRKMIIVSLKKSF